MKRLSLRVIELVKQKVVADFPELRGVEPSCSRKTLEAEIADRLEVSLPKKAEAVYVLTFRKDIPLEDVRLPRVVRATVTDEGKILKVSVSK
jgi:hypothetical protein